MKRNEAVVDALRHACPSSAVVADAPIGPRTTYRVGGAATAVVEVADASDLAGLAAVLLEAGVASLVIGRGSNLLVADAGFPGVAIVLGSGFDFETINGTWVVAGGARALPVVARATVAAGLSGFEWAVGVPGSIGGAVRMNAGGHGADMSESLVSALVLDLASAEMTRREAADLDLAYRHSSLGPQDIVVEAQLQLVPGDRENSERLLSEIVRWRRDNQPGGQNAGSVFTNPRGDSAGRLIDVAGCKGLRVGSAEVSTKHANFIQADPGGSADDVRALMVEVQRRVASSTGVELVPETHMVGFQEET